MLRGKSISHLNPLYGPLLHIASGVLVQLEHHCRKNRGFSEMLKGENAEIEMETPLPMLVIACAKGTVNPKELF